MDMRMTHYYSCHRINILSIICCCIQTHVVKREQSLEIILKMHYAVQSINTDMKSMPHAHLLLKMAICIEVIYSEERETQAKMKNKNISIFTNTMHKHML